jgi:hypothetical protein
MAEDRSTGAPGVVPSGPDVPLPAALRQLAVGPILIVGEFRSGTTWVYDMLTAHPETAGAFESWIFTQTQGVAGLLGKGHFHQDVELFGRAYRLAQLVDRERLVREMRELTAGWLAEALEPHHRFLVEKTPLHYATLPAIAQLYPQARVIHVLRDGRDVAVSTRAAARTWGQGHFRPLPAGAAAARWENAVRTARAEAPRLGLTFLEVRYEDLKAAPREGIERLLAFCDMPHDDALVAHIHDQTDFSRQQRTGQDAFRRQGRVGDWRNELGPLDCRRFERASHGLLVETGYERSRRWWLRTLVPRALWRAR